MAVPNETSAGSKSADKNSSAKAAGNKKVDKPVWWKNTYFGIAFLLVILGFVGIIGGEDSIRDPGQKREHGLALLYFAGAIIMLLNGFLSHGQTVQHYRETISNEEQ